MNELKSENGRKLELLGRADAVKYIDENKQEYLIGSMGLIRNEDNLYDIQIFTNQAFKGENISLDNLSLDYLINDKEEIDFVVNSIVSMLESNHINVILFDEKRDKEIYRTSFEEE